MPANCQGQSRLLKGSASQSWPLHGVGVFLAPDMAAVRRQHDFLGPWPLSPVWDRSLRRTFPSFGVGDSGEHRFPCLAQICTRAHTIDGGHELAGPVVHEAMQLYSRNRHDFYAMPSMIRMPGTDDAIVISTPGGRMIPTVAQATGHA